MNANTKHTCGGPAFGRLTDGCPRCEELKNGSPARRLAWQQVDRDAQRAAFKRDLADALRKARETGEVCTFGEW